MPLTMLIARAGLLLCALLGGGVAAAADTPKERIVLLGGGPTRIGLFLADADGLNERPLLAGSAVDYNPSFSADGNWIVFTSDRAGSADIYRVHPDGTGLQRLADGPSFDDQGALSPDGRTLAFVSTRDGGRSHIWLLDLATHRSGDLTKSESGNFRPNWSPDGKWIAFTSDRDAPHRRSGPGAPPPAGSGCCGWELVQSTALYIVHPDGSGLRRLTPIGSFAGSPKWSPDGKRIVYYEELGDSRGSQIASIDIESGTKQIHTSGNEVKLSPQFLSGTEIGYLIGLDGKTGLAGTSGWRGPQSKIWDPSWSPNGKVVVYAKSLAQLGPEPPTVPATGIDPDFDFYRTSTWLAYSPDGQQVVFVRDRALMVTGADGSAPRKLFEDQRAAIVAPRWSPDGAHIAFALGHLGSRNPITPAQLALIRSDGSDLRMLTQGENSSGFPSFSPDGRKLVYRVLGKERGLRILSLENGKVTKLTTARDNFPDWSPRGDRIAFTGFRTGNFEIYSIRPDGSDLRQLTHDHGNDAHAIWSPDGRWILFTSSRTGWKDEAMLCYAGGGRSPQSYGKLFVMRADGTGSRQLTDNQWEETTAAWLSPARPTKAAATQSP